MSDFNELNAERETADHWRELAEQRQKRIYELAKTALLAQEQAHKNRIDLVDMTEERDRLKDEVEALRKDARRYRTLRQYTVQSAIADGALERLDREIDARIFREKASD